VLLLIRNWPLSIFEARLIRANKGGNAMHSPLNRFGLGRVLFNWMNKRTKGDINGKS